MGKKTPYNIKIAYDKEGDLINIQESEEFFLDLSDEEKTIIYNFIIDIIEYSLIRIMKKKKIIMDINESEYVRLPDALANKINELVNEGRCTIYEQQDGKLELIIKHADDKYYDRWVWGEEGIETQEFDLKIQ